MQRAPQCFQCGPQPCLNRAQGIAGASRDLAVRQTLEKCQLDSGPLLFRQIFKRGLHAFDQLLPRRSAFEIQGRNAMPSISASPAAGLCRRNLEMARFRAITTSHAGNDPRDESKRDAVFQS